MSHRCQSCGQVWWWALCARCDAMQRVPDSLESWRCGCGAANRSWWRTASRDADAAIVSARRAEEARLLPRASGRVLAAVAVVVVVALGLTLGRASLARLDGGGTAGGAGGSGVGGGGSGGAACAAFRNYRSRSLAGEAASPEEVVRNAASASTDVRGAASRLLAASRASDPDSVMAATSELTNLCHP
ncbi:MAG: hypothetical protein QOK43_2615 [Acidimicrobiaceae bacterium]|nr:hypothetical protein [Acidimicrobiaceae bacterium]